MSNKKITVITNNVPRPMYSYYELPDEVQAEFDYVRGDSDISAQQVPRFVQYKNEWLDVADVQHIRTGDGMLVGWSMQVPPDSPLAKWDGIVSDSYFSGTLFRLVDEEYVVVGRYYS